MRVNGLWVLKFGGFRVQGFWVLGVLLIFGCFIRLGFGAFGCLEFGGHWGLGFRLLWAFECLGWCRFRDLEFEAVHVWGA